MASAVEQLVSNNTSDTPVSFYDYYNAYGKDHSPTGWLEGDPNSLGGRLQNFFAGTANSAKAAYDNYLADFEFKKNQVAKDAENKWTTEREDSQVQRAINDIRAAGLNPWLALNGGSMSSAITSSQSASARYKAKERQLKSDSKNSKLLGSALKVLLMMMLMGS